MKSLCSKNFKWDISATPQYYRIVVLINPGAGMVLVFCCTMISILIFLLVSFHNHIIVIHNPFAETSTGIA